MGAGGKGPEGPPAVVCYYGEDSFMLEKELDGLVDRGVEEEARPFDLEVLFADECGPEDVAAAANRLPFMSERRLVVLKRMERWKAAQIGSLTESYLNDPSRDCCLVLCYAAKPDRRSKTWRALEKAAGELRAFAPAGDRQLVSWIERYFRQRGMDLAPGGAEMVVEYLGSDLHRLQSELLKVELFHSGEAGTITRDRLEALLRQVATRSVFDLAPLLFGGDRGDALRLLGQLLENGEQPIQLLGLLANRCRLLLLARAVVEGGGGERAIQEILPMPPWLARKTAPELERALRCTDDARLAGSLGHLAWADAHLKRAGKEMAPAVLVALAARLAG
jgi:DNA polymerase-3 subunit delta